MGEVGDVSVEQLRCETDPQPKNGGANLRDQLLESVFRGPAASQLAVEPRGMGGPVELLMR